MIITDSGIWPGRLEKSDILIQDNGNMYPCRGCFQCWTKTPGVCVIPDRLQHISAILSRCDEVIIVSRCTYGAVSPFIKNVMDRMMPYLLPDVTVTRSGVRHKQRYHHAFDMHVYFYGQYIKEEEKETAKLLLKDTCEQLSVKNLEMKFFHDAVEIGAGL